MDFVIFSDMICFEDLVLSIQYINKRCVLTCRKVIPRSLKTFMNTERRCLQFTWDYNIPCQTCKKIKKTRLDPFEIIQGFHCTRCLMNMNITLIHGQVISLLPQKYIDVLDYVYIDLRHRQYTYLYSKKTVLALLSVVKSVNELRLERQIKKKARQENAIKKLHDMFEIHDTHPLFQTTIVKKYINKGVGIRLICRIVKYYDIIVFERERLYPNVSLNRCINLSFINGLFNRDALISGLVHEKIKDEKYECLHVFY